MRDHCRGEEDESADRRGDEPAFARRLRHHEQCRDHGCKMQRQENRARNERFFAEDQNERQQVQRQRQHPQQGRRGDVRRDVRRKGGQQGRGDQRQTDPGEAIAPCRRRGGVGVVIGRHRKIGHVARPAHEQEDQCQGDGQCCKSERPQPAQHADSERRLEQQRIAQQCDHAAEIARGIEEIGIAALRMTGRGEPGLHQRRIG